MRKYIPLLILLAILGIGFFLRFYKLGEIPVGLNQDETAIGYNAYTILHTGKDEHGMKMPLYFKSFNDYKLPVYIYMTSISEKLFGLTPFAVRFPSALFGCVTILALFYLVKVMTKKITLSLLSSLLLAINPWHIFFSRIAFEVNVATSFLVFGSLFFFLGLQKNKSVLYYILSVICFGISLYTYNITRIFAPMLFVFLIMCNRKIFFSQSKVVVSSIIVLFIGVMTPFLATLLGGSNITNQQFVLLTGGNAKASMIELRSYLVPLPHIVSALFFNSYFLLIWQYIGNIAASLSPLFFFKAAGVTGGGDVGVGTVGMFYPLELLTIIIGIVFVVRKKVSNTFFFLYWTLALFLLVSISAIVPVGTRNFPVIIPLVFFSAYGIYESYIFLRKKHTYIRYAFLGILFLSFGYSVLYFLASYYFYFPVAYARTWRTADKDVAMYLAGNAKNYKTILIDKDANFIYTSLVFYQKYDPKNFLREVKYEPDSLFTSVERVGKYEFRKIDWTKDQYLSHTLFVTSKTDYPKDFIKQKEFSYPTRPVVLNVEGKILQFPVTDVAYEVFSK